MTKNKTEKIASLEEQILQLENQRKRLLQQQKEQEHKDRTKRLCRRAGLLESLLPDTILLTDEQFKTLLEKTILTEQSRRILDGLTAQNAAAERSEKMTKEYILDPLGKKIYDQKSGNTSATLYPPPIETSRPKPRNGAARGLIVLMPHWRSKA